MCNTCVHVHGYSQLTKSAAEDMHKRSEITSLVIGIRDNLKLLVYLRFSKRGVGEGDYITVPAVLYSFIAEEEGC